MSLANQLLSRWAPVIRAVELVSGSDGVFEISLDGELLFSKKETGRFPRPGEMTGLFEIRLGPALEWRAST